MGQTAETFAQTKPAPTLVPYPSHVPSETVKAISGSADAHCMH